MAKLSSIILCAVFIGLFNQKSYGQAGTLDTTFGINGIIATSIGNAKDFASSIVFQPDGKIVVAGTSRFGRYNDFSLVRYQTNGFLDSLFGNNGIVSTAIGSSNDDGNAVALQADGKIVVCGDSHNGTDFDFAVVRYQSNGLLDSLFGTDGKVVTPIGSSNDYGISLIIQSDGKIIIAGFSDNGNDNDIALVRYNTDGSLDGLFGSGGIVTTTIGAGNERGHSLALQPDGKIIVAGYSHNGNDDDIALVRYNSDGNLDTGFGSGGKVVQGIVTNSEDVIYSVMLQSDGKIVMAGETIDSTNYNFAIVRCDGSGNLDSSFGTNGMVCTAIGSGNDYGHSLAIQSDGKFLVAGFSSNGTNDDFAIVRYNTDGTLDSTFGNGGKSTIAIGSYDDKSNCVNIQPDGKIIVVGASFNGANIDFAAIRLNN
jgi:uncharacterized delta-60 repeat protein